MIETICVHLEETASATFYSCAVTIASRESGRIFVKPYGTDEVLEIDCSDAESRISHCRNTSLLTHHFALIQADNSVNCVISGEMSNAPRVTDEEKFSRKLVEYTTGLGFSAAEYKNGFVTCTGYTATETAENFICAMRTAESVSSLNSSKTRGFRSLNEFFANKRK